jgi:hypothetical protein
VKSKKVKKIIALILLALLIVLTVFFKTLEAKFEGRILYSTIFLILTAICVLLLEARLKKVLRHTFIGSYIEGEPQKIFSPNEINKLKSSVLLYTKQECDSRFATIIGPEIANNNFHIETKFTPGKRPSNISGKWHEHYKEQFLFITGERGSGKSFELLGRIKSICEKLKAGFSEITSLEREKIPLYIELKSLNTVLDKDWITDYIIRSANIAHTKLSNDEVKTLLESKSIVYFFDGLDEVDIQFREQAARKILEFADETGVTVSCRKELFEDLKARDIIPLIDSPAELFLEPLTEKKIVKIIQDLKGYSADEKSGMINFIGNKSNLLEHLSRTIILNLFVLTYHNLSPNAKSKLESADGQGTLNILWEKYEDIIVKKLPRDADILAIRTYTVWLAKIMQQKPFFVESIQPNWLCIVDESNDVRPSETLQKLFYLFTRVIACVIIGIAIGFIISVPSALISDSILGGLTITLISGIYNNKPLSLNGSKSIADKMFPVFMIVSLVLVCGIYQGFSVPRMPSEMTTAGFSLNETFAGVILGLILSTIFSYRVTLEKIRKQYILPVEIFHFDWFHAIRYGLTWGFVSGIITGCLAIAVGHYNKNSVFFENWLIPHLRPIATRFHRPLISPQQTDMAIFIYAFIVAFTLVSLIIAIMAGRYSDKVQKDEEKQKLNYAIKESFKHAAINAFYVASVSCALYFLAMKLGIGDWYHCIMICLGMYLLAFLWFGGMEVMNHVLLRTNLYIRGIAPPNYDPWVQANQTMGLIQPTGYQMKFYHPTLANYYIEYPLVNEYSVPRIRLNKNKSVDFKIYAIFIIVSMFLLIFPFANRNRAYWKSRHEIKANFEKKDIVLENDSTYRILRTGKLTISATGRINVGTLVGWVWPIGTRHGIMGMPIDSAYNIKDFKELLSLRHGALMYRLQRAGNNWDLYNYVVDGADTAKVLKVNKGDRLQFIINDREWQNNTGHYKVKMHIFL